MTKYICQQISSFFNLTYRRFRSFIALVSGILSRNPNLSTLVILSSIILYGAYLRLFQLSTQSYWMDEGYTVLATMMMGKNGTGVVVLPGGNIYHCGVYCALTSPVVSFFGMNEFSMRVVAALAGTFLIPIIFLLTRRLFSKNIALIASAFTAFSYWQIAWSRQARWYTLLALFFWTALYFVHRTLYDKTNNARSMVLAFIFTALAILTHPIGLLLPIIEYAWIILDPNARKKILSLLHTTKKTSRFALAFALFFVLAWVWNKFIALSSIISLSNSLSHYLIFYLTQYWLFMLFIVIALILRPKEHVVSVWLLFLIFLTYLVPLSFLSNIIQYRYLFHATPAILILGAAGTVYVYMLMQNRALKIIFVLLVVTCFFLTYSIPNSGGVFLPSNTYFLESDAIDQSSTTTYYSYTPQPDWRSAYKNILDTKSFNDILISSHPHFTYIYAGISGYWFPINYGKNVPLAQPTSNMPDWYVGALPVSDLTSLKKLIAQHHGFIVFDEQARDGRISNDMLNFIDENLPQTFYYATNTYSKIWVYRF